MSAFLALWGFQSGSGKEEKEGIQILEKRVEGKPVNLYELEEMVYV